MAAATLARFLGPTFRISLVESDAIGTIGVGEATIPQIHLYLSALGIDEGEFLAATNATFKLGIEFQNWAAPGHSYMHAFGPVGRGSGITPFRQLWSRARAEGKADEFGAYSLNEVTARAGRMAGSDGRPSAIPDLAYAYHFDASLLAKYLRGYAEQRGVVRIEGMIDAVERDAESGDITFLTLDRERRVAGDLFIDCTGFRGLLMNALGVAYQDWSNFLPCDRALAVPCARSDSFRPFTQSIAHRAGWQWRIPLQHRTGNGHVYCSSFISDDEAAAVLLGNLDGDPADAPRPLRFTTGRRAQHWSHNCVALGLAAGFMEPLESTSIHLVQSGIARLLPLISAGPTSPAARATFNRLTAGEWARIRDFLVLHYVANARIGEPFWDHCRVMPVPDTLAEKIDLFRETGTIIREEDELFTEDSWSQVMIGQGIIPQHWSPLADTVPIDELDAYLATIAAAYRRKAAQLPTHAAYVAQRVGSPVRESAA